MKPHLPNAREAAPDVADLMDTGRIGIISRSATLAREAEHQLEKFGLGASKVVVPSPGENHCELLKMFEHHWGTDAVLLLGPIDAGEVEPCADWIAHHMHKPVIGFIDPAGADPAQEARLRASGVRMSRDVAGIGELAASLVDLPSLPFD